MKSKLNNFLIIAIKRQKLLDSRIINISISIYFEFLLFFYLPSLYFFVLSTTQTVLLSVAKRQRFFAFLLSKYMML